MEDKKAALFECAKELFATKGFKDTNVADITKMAGMGTRMMHKAFGIHGEEALCAVKGEARRLESLLSRFLPESEIGRVNASVGMKNEGIGAETY